MTENTSTCGKYKVGSNQVALTQIGDTDVSTVWMPRPGMAGDWFETLTFVDGNATKPTPDVYFSEADAFQGHAAAVSALVLSLTNDDDPDEDDGLDGGPSREN